MSGPQVKICGVKDIETALAAARAGADFLGFVFFRKSPRFIQPEKAEEIILDLKEASFEEGFALPKLVGLFVDAGEKELSEAPTLLTHFQFHGHESAERCRELGEEFAVEIIKALPVSEPDDVLKASEFEGAADIILFDAKPPPGAGRPGGHGVSFDWSAVSSYEGETPFILAGGLTPDNVADAVASQKDHSGFVGVDVSSGVEDAPGKKSPALISAFISSAKGA
ncbi:phosphoribosylanthranilate isomerase [Hyphococcus sp. DH-69]|uniref:phosphoribosylanthranilate isomerase n=1 Tax=Hyphococcus formosus TaxID=3143534 RepID=UPI00398BB090